MKKLSFFLIIAIISSSFLFAEGDVNEVNRPFEGNNDLPNVIIIYTDDLGYGDLGCYGNEAINTPNINKLASNGCLFTDAYVSAAVCTPSRYGLLTGRYPWRTFLKKNVIADSPSLIDPQRYTLPKLFKDAGYVTAAIGKWHLGFGNERNAEINYNEPVVPGPNEVGFDYFFGLPVGHFFPPYVYMRNHLVVGLEQDDPIRIIRPDEGKPYQEGGESARIDREEVSVVLFDEARSFIEENKSNPFLLYLSTTKPHTPFDRHEDFADSGPLSDYGDVIRELDFRVGELMDVIEGLGITSNTMVIFTSDNGGISSDHGLFQQLGIEPNTNYPLRGDKGDVLEGGVRIPFIIQYPERIEAGTTSSAPFCMTDLMASFGAMLNIKIPGNAAEDSYNVLPALLNEGPVSDHPFVLQGRAGTLGLRWGEWKYIPDPGNGDNNSNPPPDAPPVQLYRITEDISEQNNLYDQYPNKVHIMDEMLNRIKETSGKSVW